MMHPVQQAPGRQFRQRRDRRRLRQRKFHTSADRQPAGVPRRRDDAIIALADKFVRDLPIKLNIRRNQPEGPLPRRHVFGQGCQDSLHQWVRLAVGIELESGKECAVAERQPQDPARSLPGVRGLRLVRAAVTRARVNGGAVEHLELFEKRARSSAFCRSILLSAWAKGSTSRNASTIPSIRRS